MFQALFQISIENLLNGTIKQFAHILNTHLTFLILPYIYVFILSVFPFI